MSKEKNIQHKMNFWVDKDLYLDFDAAVKKNFTNMTYALRNFMKAYVDKNKEVASP